MADHHVETFAHAGEVVASCEACSLYAFGLTAKDARAALESDRLDNLHFLNRCGDRLSGHMARVRDAMRAHVALIGKDA